MSKFMDAVVNAREDEDEAQMRSLFYGAGGFDSEDESDVEKVEENTDQHEEAAAEKVATVSSVIVASNSDISITVQECREKGIAHQIWPAATFLAEYIVQNPHLLYSDSPAASGDHTTAQQVEALSILELGAGLGLTGIFAAKYFNQNPALPHLRLQHTVLSDLAEALTGLQDNITLNHMNESVSASVLSWGVQEELDATLDIFQTVSSSVPSDVKTRKTLVILAADVIYWEHLFNPLIASIEQVLARVHRTQEFDQVRILIAHYKRWKKDQAFLQRIQKSLQKSGHGTFACLHEEVLQRHEHHGESDGVENTAASSIAVLGKKEIRRIYQIKSTSR